jgi:hypothetical protein
MNPADAIPATLDAHSIVDHYDLRFDAADKLNGSLYLCTPRGTPAPAAALAALRAAGLWSSEPEKCVPDEQRQAYKDGLQFVAAAAYRDGEGHILLARFDHPKFPSDGGRFAAWRALFDGAHERLR